MQAQGVEVVEKTDVEKVMDALHKMAINDHNAFAAKTYLQAKGEFVEKAEVKLGLSADEISRRNLEAERQLRDSGYLLPKGESSA